VGKGYQLSDNTVGFCPDNLLILSAISNYYFYFEYAG